MRIDPLRTLFQRKTLFAVICIAALAAGCATPEQSTDHAVVSHGQLDAARFPQIDAGINEAIAAHQLPGAVFHLERNGDRYEQAYGRLSYAPDAAKVTVHTVYDAASLTKVLATAPSVLMLAEQGKIDLDAKLAQYFPECAGEGKATITIRNLLTHSSGLPSGLPAIPSWHGSPAAHALACAQSVDHAPGTFFRYSDINFILLGQLVERVSGMPLNEFARIHIYAPLHMRDTGFLPLRRGVPVASIAPTQVGRAPSEGEKDAHADLAPGQVLQGVVHDPTARRMDGVAGSAGVFTTASDIARYARMVLAGGTLDGVRILSPDSVRLLTTVQSPPGVAPRGLGMDIDSPYAVRPRGTVFPVGSFGHTGFTGCILWIDPGSHTFYVFLSNRVYPDDKSNVLALYTKLGTLSAEAGGVVAPATAVALH
ncbi:MAG TPA: serine hydrolase domain-containing protein [Telluria sp.]